MEPYSSKRSREKPSGSKNNEKNDEVLDGEFDNFLNQIVFEIPVGNDLAESLINVARNHNASISVLSASGFVSDVTLLHSVTGVPAAPMPGPFKMMLLSGSYINPNRGLDHPLLTKNPPCSCFHIYLSGTLGQVCGGFIGGKIMTASKVMITAALFNQSEYDILSSTRGGGKEYEDGEGDTNVDSALAEPNTIHN